MDKKEINSNLEDEEYYKKIDNFINSIILNYKNNNKIDYYINYLMKNDDIATFDKNNDKLQLDQNFEKYIYLINDLLGKNGNQNIDIINDNNNIFNDINFFKNRQNHNTITTNDFKFNLKNNSLFQLLYSNLIFKIKLRNILVNKYLDNLKENYYSSYNYNSSYERNNYYYLIYNLLISTIININYYSKKNSKTLDENIELLYNSYNILFDLLGLNKNIFLLSINILQKIYNNFKDEKIKKEEPINEKNINIITLLKLLFKIYEINYKPEFDYNNFRYNYIYLNEIDNTNINILINNLKIDENKKYFDKLNEIKIDIFNDELINNILIEYHKYFTINKYKYSINQDIFFDEEIYDINKYINEDINKINDEELLNFYNNNKMLFNFMNIKNIDELKENINFNKLIDNKEILELLEENEYMKNNILLIYNSLKKIFFCNIINFGQIYSNIDLKDNSKILKRYDNILINDINTFKLNYLKNKKEEEIIYKLRNHKINFIHINFIDDDIGHAIYTLIIDITEIKNLEFIKFINKNKLFNEIDLELFKQIDIQEDKQINKQLEDYNKKINLLENEINILKQEILNDENCLINEELINDYNDILFLKNKLQYLCNNITPEQEIKLFNNQKIEIKQEPIQKPKQYDTYKQDLVYDNDNQFGGIITNNEEQIYDSEIYYGLDRKKLTNFNKLRNVINKFDDFFDKYNKIIEKIKELEEYKNEYENKKILKDKYIMFLIDDNIGVFMLNRIINLNEYDDITKKLKIFRSIIIDDKNFNITPQSLTLFYLNNNFNFVKNDLLYEIIPKQRAGSCLYTNYYATICIIEYLKLNKNNKFFSTSFYNILTDIITFNLIYENNIKYINYINNNYNFKEKDFTKYFVINEKSYQNYFINRYKKLFSTDEILNYFSFNYQYLILKIYKTFDNNDLIDYNNEYNTYYNIKDKTLQYLICLEKIFKKLYNINLDDYKKQYLDEENNLKEKKYNNIDDYLIYNLFKIYIKLKNNYDYLLYDVDFKTNIYKNNFLKIYDKLDNIPDYKFDIKKKDNFINDNIIDNINKLNHMDLINYILKLYNKSINYIYDKKYDILPIENDIIDLNNFNYKIFNNYLQKYDYMIIEETKEINKKTKKSSDLIYLNPVHNYIILLLYILTLSFEYIEFIYNNNKNILNTLFNEFSEDKKDYVIFLYLPVFDFIKNISNNKIDFEEYNFNINFNEDFDEKDNYIKDNTYIKQFIYVIEKQLNINNDKEQQINKKNEEEIKILLNNFNIDNIKNYSHKNIIKELVKHKYIKIKNDDYYTQFIFYHFYKNSYFEDIKNSKYDKNTLHKTIIYYPNIVSYNNYKLIDNLTQINYLNNEELINKFKLNNIMNCDLNKNNNFSNYFNINFGIHIFNINLYVLYALITHNYNIINNTNDFKNNSTKYNSLNLEELKQDDIDYYQLEFIDYFNPNNLLFSDNINSIKIDTNDDYTIKTNKTKILLTNNNVIDITENIMFDDWYYIHINSFFNNQLSELYNSIFYNNFDYPFHNNIFSLNILNIINKSIISNNIDYLLKTLNIYNDTSYISKYKIIYIDMNKIKYLNDININLYDKQKNFQKYLINTINLINEIITTDKLEYLYSINFNIFNSFILIFSFIFNLKEYYNINDNDLVDDIKENYNNFIKLFLKIMNFILQIDTSLLDYEKIFYDNNYIYEYNNYKIKEQYKLLLQYHYILFYLNKYYVLYYDNIKSYFEVDNINFIPYFSQILKYKKIYNIFKDNLIVNKYNYIKDDKNILLNVLETTNKCELKLYIPEDINYKPFIIINNTRYLIDEIEKELFVEDDFIYSNNIKNNQNIINCNELIFNDIPEKKLNNTKLFMCNNIFINEQCPLIFAVNYDLNYEYISYIFYMNEFYKINTFKLNQEKYYPNLNISLFDNFNTKLIYNVNNNQFYILLLKGNKDLLNKHLINYINEDEQEKIKKINLKNTIDTIDTTDNIDNYINKKPINSIYIYNISNNLLTITSKNIKELKDNFNYFTSQFYLLENNLYNSSNKSINHFIFNNNILKHNKLINYTNSYIQYIKKLLEQNKDKEDFYINIDIIIDYIINVFSGIYYSYSYFITYYNYLYITYKIYFIINQLKKIKNNNLKDKDNIIEYIYNIIDDDSNYIKYKQEKENSKKENIINFEEKINDIIDIISLINSNQQNKTMDKTEIKNNIIKTLIIFENVSNKEIRNDQLEIIFDIFKEISLHYYYNFYKQDEINKLEPYNIYQFLMGKGKSSVITPALSFLFNNILDMKFILLLPEHLTKSAYNETLGIYNNILKYDISLIENYNDDIINYNNLIISISMFNYNSLNNKLNNYKEYNNNNVVVIIDEIDTALDFSLTNFNIIEEEKTLNLNYSLIFDIIYKYKGIHNLLNNLNDKKNKDIKIILDEFKKIEKDNNFNIFEIKNLILGVHYDLYDDKLLPLKKANDPILNSQFSNIFITILCLIDCYIYYFINNNIKPFDDKNIREKYMLKFKIDENNEIIKINNEEKQFNKITFNIYKSYVIKQIQNNILITTQLKNTTTQDNIDKFIFKTGYSGTTNILSYLYLNSYNSIGNQYDISIINKQNLSKTQQSLLKQQTQQEKLLNQQIINKYLINQYEENIDYNDKKYIFKRSKKYIKIDKTYKKSLLKIFNKIKKENIKINDLYEYSYKDLLNNIIENNINCVIDSFGFFENKNSYVIINDLINLYNEKNINIDDMIFIYITLNDEIRMIYNNTNSSFNINLLSSNKKIFVLYDHKHTVGTDIQLPLYNEFNIIILVNYYKTTLTEYMQSIYRIRKIEFDNYNIFNFVYINNNNDIQQNYSNMFYYLFNNDKQQYLTQLQQLNYKYYNLDNNTKLYKLLINNEQFKLNNNIKSMLIQNLKYFMKLKDDTYYTIKYNEDIINSYGDIIENKLEIFYNKLIDYYKDNELILSFINLNYYKLLSLSKNSIINISFNKEKDKDKEKEKEKEKEKDKEKYNFSNEDYYNYIYQPFNNYNNIDDIIKNYLDKDTILIPNNNIYYNNIKIEKSNIMTNYIFNEFNHNLYKKLSIDIILYILINNSLYLDNFKDYSSEQIDEVEISIINFNNYIKNILLQKKEINITIYLRNIILDYYIKLNIPYNKNIYYNLLFIPFEYIILYFYKDFSINILNDFNINIILKYFSDFKNINKIDYNILGIYIKNILNNYDNKKIMEYKDNITINFIELENDFYKLFDNIKFNNDLLQNLNINYKNQEFINFKNIFDYICKFINLDIDKLDNPLNGGNNLLYFYKYIQYKNKYLHLKNNK